LILAASSDVAAVADVDAGVAVAVLDTGASWEHPLLVKQRAATTVAIFRMMVLVYCSGLGAGG
jgi:hypothetical protein